MFEKKCFRIGYSTVFGSEIPGQFFLSLQIFEIFEVFFETVPFLVDCICI